MACIKVSLTVETLLKSIYCKGDYLCIYFNICTIYMGMGEPTRGGGEGWSGLGWVWFEYGGGGGGEGDKKYSCIEIVHVFWDLVFIFSTYI